MYCVSAWNVLLCMILYQQNTVVYMENLTLSLETSPLHCGKVVKLKCVYSGTTCCTNARLWTLNGTQIMNNGGATNNSKHQEERNDTGFNFNIKILDLQDSDFGKPFQCHYNFKSSNNVTIAKDNKYECLQTELGPFSHNRDMDNIKIKGMLNITKAAPSPVIHVFYGEDNMTSGFSTIEHTNYDTWYYFSTVVIVQLVDCYGRSNEKFKLNVITGTTTTLIFEMDMCECDICGGKCVLCGSSIPLAVSLFLIGLFLINCYKGIFTEGSDNTTVLKKVAIYGITTLLIDAIVALLVGKITCFCNEGYSWRYLFIVLLPLFGTGLIGILVMHKIHIQFDYQYLLDHHKWKTVLGFIGGGISLLYIATIDKHSYEHKKEIADDGADVLLKCPYKSREKITWTRTKGQQLLSTKVRVINQPIGEALTDKVQVIEGNHLMIRSVQQCDAGTYICAHRGQSHNIKLTVKAKLIVETIGSDVLLPSPFNPSDGQITWCKLDGFIRKTRNRYSEGIDINKILPDNLTERLNATGKDLCIKSVKKSDEGIYECLLAPKKASLVPQSAKLQLTVSDGGKNSSTESGSTCWPICRVGQDPNTPSSDPENARRSPVKERADKKKDRKPTEVVRPQPSRAQHLKTDNSGRAEYSAENEIYSEKVLKSSKPRLLPSIGQLTDSPRPLPQMPTSAQQGGYQLAPLEKKKKKRKKKRETRQSDEENSTEL